MEVPGKGRVLVIGLGVSGRAAAEKLLALGREVCANDASDDPPVRETAGYLEGLGAEVILGHHSPALLEGVDLVVVSPGVPPRLPLLVEAGRRGIPVWSEVELGWRFARGPVVAVTGTNGKTTTVSMIEFILNRAGRKARAAGNIGHPFVRAVEEAEEREILVVEVSSFQLHYTETFHPRVAVLLNVAEDHFDWHPDMEDYLSSKKKIWRNQGREDVAVCNLDDPLCEISAREAESRVMFFSRRPHPESAVFLAGDKVMFDPGWAGVRRGGPVELVRRDGLALPGEHNLQNAMAAAAVCLALGCGPDDVREGMENFRGLPHRLQAVGEVGGVRFYNDSKATNPHAAARAVEAFEDPMVVILGGRNKGMRFDELARALAGAEDGGRLREVFLVGEAADDIGSCLRRLAPRVSFRVKGGLEEVFKDLPLLVKPGDVVLFTPACASFDRYRDYRERGEHFVSLVKEMQGGEGG